MCAALNKNKNKNKKVYTLQCMQNCMQKGLSQIITEKHFPLRSYYPSIIRTAYNVLKIELTAVIVSYRYWAGGSIKE